MTRLTTRRLAVHPDLFHGLVELAFMRVLMADGAGAVVEAVDHRVLGLGSGTLLVAITAGSCDMAAGEREARLLVLRQREGRGMVTLEVVALFAAIQVRRSGELTLVLVFVTVHAFAELDLEERVLPLGYMAPFALHLGVLAFQRVSAFGVFFHSISRRLEAVQGVTAGAFDSPRSFHELAVVHVLVAVDAFLESQRLLEVSLEVALRTFNRLVFAEQGIFRFGMVEFFVDGLQRAAFPAARIVAGLASLLLEAALVRISVAIVALAEGQTGPTRLIIRSGSVALLASHLRVQSR